MRFLFVLLFYLVCLSAEAQYNTMSAAGKFYGENIYILNPTVGDGFSVKKIVVNKDTLLDELNSNALEIDFATIGIKNEQEVLVTLIFDSLNPPHILNPEVLYPPEDLRFSKPRFRDNILQWRVGGSLSDYPMVIEQFKWNKWYKIGEVDPLDTVENQTYNLMVRFHSGENQFRIKTYNFNGEEVISKSILQRSVNIPEVKMVSTKITNEIEFTSDTEYELYSETGELLLQGFDRYIDVGKLEKGVYFLNFDNSMTQIKKK